MTRSRTRRSAKQAGAAFERQVADYLAVHVDDRIDRRVRTGALDRGDITGLRHLGQRIAVEVKNTARWTPGPWLDEADRERGNDGAAVGLVVAKRHGRSDPGDAVVLMTLRDLALLLTGAHPQSSTCRTADCGPEAANPQATRTDTPDPRGGSPGCPQSLHSSVGAQAADLPTI